MNPTIRSIVIAITAAAALPNVRLRAQEPEHREEIPRLASDVELRHNRQFLVSAESLAARLARHAPDLVVVYVGHGDSSYRAGHIPGARFLALGEVAATVNGVPNEFPPLDQVREAFARLGVRDASRIVVYGDDPGVMAARAWVALDLLGMADQSAVLDGGLAAWRALNLPLDAGPAVPGVGGRLSPRAASPESRVVSAEFVRTHLGDSTVLLVDARPAEQFAAGHIPGASNLFWMDQLTSQGLLRPMPELHHVLWRGAGANRPAVKTIVAYCRTGMQASHAYFVARYLGYPDVRLYDGSMAEWSTLPAADHPVERGAPPQQ